VRVEGPHRQTQEEGGAALAPPLFHVRVSRTAPEERTAVMAEGRKLVVEDWELGGNGLEAFYTEQPFPAMAIQPDLDPAVKRAWELVGHWLHEYATDRQKSRLFVRMSAREDDDRRNVLMWKVGELKDIRPWVRRALREVVDDLEPGWVKAVEEASRAADTAYLASAYSGVPLAAVVAIRDNLRTRSEDSSSRADGSEPAETESPRADGGRESAEDAKTALLPDSFEVFDYRTRRPKDEEGPMVSITIGGAFGFNRPAMELLDRAEGVELMFNPRRRRIGFRPATDEVPWAYPLRDNSGSGGTCSGKAFMDRYGIPYHERRRYSARLVDGVLVVDL